MASQSSFDLSFPNDKDVVHFKEYLLAILVIYLSTLNSVVQFLIGLFVFLLFRFTSRY